MTHFSKIDVVVLPTKNNTNLTLALHYNELRRVHSDYKFKVNDEQYARLVVFSNDEIKKGDWVIDIIRHDIFKAGEGYDEQSRIKKIIASNDKTLVTGRKIMPDGSIFDPNSDWDIKFGVKSGFGLQRIQRDETIPQLTDEFIDDFIKSYNNGEKNIVGLCQYEAIPFSPSAPNRERSSRVKINYEDNTINVKICKDYWTREDIINLFDKFGFEATSKQIKMGHITTEFVADRKNIENFLKNHL